jgi:NTP pyrophosphatase (non-canonical NTP hydrolase)
MINLKQKEFANWQKYNFGETDIHEMILGVCEEAGEMAHWYLKGKQNIRGANESITKEKIADAFGDVVVFGIQAMTCIGMDAEEVLKKVFDEVLARNWKENPTGAGYSQHKQ